MCSKTNSLKNTGITKTMCRYMKSLHKRHYVPLGEKSIKLLMHIKSIRYLFYHDNLNLLSSTCTSLPFSRFSPMGKRFFPRKVKKGSVMNRVCKCFEYFSDQAVPCSPTTLPQVNKRHRELTGGRHFFHI